MMRQQRQAKTVGDQSGVICDIILGAVFGAPAMQISRVAGVASSVYEDRYNAKLAASPAPAPTKTIAEQERDFFKPTGFGFSRAFVL